MEEGLIKRLMASIKCNTCEQHYEVDNISVIGHYGGVWFLSAFCAACHTQCLVAAVVKKSGAPEVTTDLDEAELYGFNSVGVLTADDRLDMHNFLKTFDGDFSRLFSQE